MFPLHFIFRQSSYTKGSNICRHIFLSIVSILKLLRLICVPLVIFFIIPIQQGYGSENGTKSPTTDFGYQPEYLKGTVYSDSHPKSLDKPYLPMDSNSFSFIPDSSLKYSNTPKISPSQSTDPNSADQAPTQRDANISQESAIPSDGDEHNDVEVKPGSADTNAAASPLMAGSSAKAMFESDVQSSVKSCEKAYNLARAACLESLNPDIQKGIAALNTLMSGAKMMGVVDKCGAMGKAMDVASMALTAYTAACGALKATCDSFCGGIKEKTANLVKAAEADYAACTKAGPPSEKCTASLMAAQEVKKSEDFTDPGAPTKASSGNRNKQCNVAFGWHLVSAGTGLMNMIMPLMSQAKSCKKNSDGSGNQPTADNAVDCSKKKFESFPQCLCQANPLQSGCANVLKQMRSPESGFGGANNVTAGNTGNNNLAGLGTGGNGSDPFLPDNANNSSGGNPPGGSGGGGAGLGGGSGSSGPTKPETGRMGSNLNTKILGEGGGMGGGGGFRGPSAALTDSGKNLKKDFGPNSDYAKKMTAYSDARKQVGFANGPSLFEKVNRAYSDIRNGLLP